MGWCSKASSVNDDGRQEGEQDDSVMCLGVRLVKEHLTDGGESNDDSGDETEDDADCREHDDTGREAEQGKARQGK